MKKELLKKAGAGLQKAAKTSFRVGRLSAAHCRETKRLLKENQERWQRAVEKYQNAVSRVTVTIEKTQELLGICRRYGLTEKEMPFPPAQSLEKKFPDISLKQDGSFVFKGAAAGTAAVTSALGGTAIFGTASTGAAISGLHGAAAAGATLANLGGGSLAAGGLGIAGGVATLGATFALPAVAVGTYLWDQSVRKQHEKVLAYEKAVQAECQILQQVYRRYDAFNMRLMRWLIDVQRKNLLTKH